MELQFSKTAWNDYLYWQQHDKTIIKQINRLIADIQHHPFTGIGKPEPLKYHLQGCYSRRITDEHRLVYRADNNTIQIVSLRYHYKK